MSEQVSWFLELAVKPGQIDDVRALIREMAESAQTEPGALNYEWSISGDERVIHSYERYADSGAVLAHLSVFGEKFAERLLGAVDGLRRPDSSGQRGARRLRSALHDTVRRIRTQTGRSGDAGPSERHVAGNWRSPWKTASTLFPSGSMTNAA
jgi:quinol monooxygenase YgiN